MADNDDATHHDQTEQEEKELHSTHGFIQERDLDRNGVPDHLEAAEKDSVVNLNRDKRDINRNGIPDHLEGGEAGNDYAVFDKKVHRNSALDRSTREVAGVLAITQDTDTPSIDYNDRVRAASSKAAKHIQKDEANHQKGGFGRDELVKRMAKLRAKRAHRGSFVGDLSRLPAAKADPDNGFESVKASWRGLLTAIVSSRAAEKAKQDARLQQEMEDLRANQADLEKADRLANAEAERATDKALTADGSSGTGNAEADPSAETVPVPEQSSKPSAEHEASPADGNTPEAANGTAPKATPEIPAQVGQTQDAKPTGDSTSDTIPAGKSPNEVGNDTAVGNSGLGMAIASANPVAGVALTALQTAQAQKDAGNNFDQKKADQDKKSTQGTHIAGLPSVSSAPNRGYSGPQNGRRILSLAPNPSQAGKPANDQRVAILKPAVQPKGPLFEQSRKLARPKEAVVSVGPANPPPRVRALGLGTGIGAFIMAARSIAPRDEHLTRLQSMHIERDSIGRER